MTDRTDRRHPAVTGSAVIGARDPFGAPDPNHLPVSAGPDAQERAISAVESELQERVAAGQDIQKIEITTPGGGRVVGWIDWTALHSLTEAERLDALTETLATMQQQISYLAVARDKSQQRGAMLGLDLLGLHDRLQRIEEHLGIPAGHVPAISANATAAITPPPDRDR